MLAVASTPFQPDVQFPLSPSHYNYISLLGRGTFGNVVHAKSKSEHPIEVAIKISKIYGNEDRKGVTISVDHWSQAASLREEAMFSYLTPLDHQHSLVRFFGGFDDNIGRRFTIYEMLTYGNLIQTFFCTEQAPPRISFNAQSVQILVQDLFKALEFLSLHRVVHGDLSLRNVGCRGVSGHYQFCLIDLGTAFFLDEGPPYEGNFCTSEYRAPELLLHTILSRSSIPEGILSQFIVNQRETWTSMLDYWSLGIIFLHLYVPSWITPIRKEMQQEFFQLTGTAWHHEEQRKLCQVVTDLCGPFDRDEFHRSYIKFWMMQKDHDKVLHQPHFFAQYVEEHDLELQGHFETVQERLPVFENQIRSLLQINSKSRRLLNVSP